MKLKVITLDGKQQEIECDTFEFRRNTVSSWLRIVKDGKEKIIHQVATIKYCD